MRTAIRAGIADVYSQDNVPERADDYRPHVTLAYSTREQPAEPVIAAVDAVQSAPATIAVSQSALIELGRDDGMHRWRMVGAARLRAPSIT